MAIVALIAAVVFVLPGGGRAANTFEGVLVVGFGAGIGYLGLRLYRENRIALHSLGDRHRGLLYGAIALAFFQGLSHAELAAHLREPLGTVKSWIRRGLERLKRCLDATGITH